jgi:hypothetical protein
MNADTLKAKLKEFADKTGDGKVDIKDAEALIDWAKANFVDDWFENVVIALVFTLFGFLLGKFL